MAQAKDTPPQRCFGLVYTTQHMVTHGCARFCMSCAAGPLGLCQGAPWLTCHHDAMLVDLGLCSLLHAKWCRLSGSLWGCVWPCECSLLHASSLMPAGWLVLTSARHLVQAPKIPAGVYLDYWDSKRSRMLVNARGMELSNHWGAHDQVRQLTQMGQQGQSQCLPQRWQMLQWCQFGVAAVHRCVQKCQFWPLQVFDGWQAQHVHIVVRAAQLQL